MNFYDYVKCSYTSNIPRSISWDVTNRCNLKCKHCFNNSGDAKCYDFSTEMSREKAIELANEIAGLGVEQVCLCGGETFLCDHLFDIIQILRSGGVTTSIVSNGCLINEEIIPRLKEAGVYQVQISIDGLGYQHDMFRGKIGVFEKASNAVRQLVGANIKTLVSCCPNRYNYSCFEQYVEYIYSLGCRTLRMMPLLPIGRAQSYLSEIMLSDSQLFELVNKITYLSSKYKDLDIEWGDPLEHLHIVLQKRRRYPLVMTIRANGDVGITPYIDIIVGNIHEKSITELWNDGYSKIWSNREVIEIIKNIKCINDLPKYNDTYRVLI